MSCAWAVGGGRGEQRGGERGKGNSRTKILSQIWKYMSLTQPYRDKYLP